MNYPGRRSAPNLLIGVLLIAAAVIAFVYFFSMYVMTADVKRELQQLRTEERSEQVQPSPNVRIPGALEAVNAYRESRGLPDLKINELLNQSAEAKALDMVQLNYFDHYKNQVSPWNFMTAVGYEYKIAGENLARCYPKDTSFVTGWINSPTHARVMQEDYTEVGFGIAYNSEDNCNYVVAHFGKPLR